MAPPEELEDLLIAWESGWREGHDVSAARLTDDSRLWDALDREIEKRRRVLRVLAGALEGGAGPEPPRSIGKFTDLSLLGRGGMGVVYRAWQTDLKRPVALKMIPAGADAAPGQLARLRVEAEAMARLRHPGVVQLYEIGECAGQTYLVMELVEGPNLARAVGGRPQNAVVAARVVEQVARAVQAAHDAGIVHRDLKPANVLLSGPAGAPTEGPIDLSTEGWVPRVTDFGLAKRLDAPTASGSGVPLGTAAYMPPEQAGGRTQEIGPAADVYGLGTILYECLTGRPPFAGQSFAETVLAVLNEEPASPRAVNPRVPADLNTICLKCLDKDPRRRYASAALLADDLRRFQEGRPVLARPLGLARRGWRWCRRNPAVAGLLTALVAALAAVGAAAHIADRERRQHLATVLETSTTLLETVEQLAEGDLSLPMAGGPGGGPVARTDPRLRAEVAAPALRSIAAMKSERPELVIVRARAHLALGVYGWASGEWEQAAADYHRAIDLLAPLQRTHPGARFYLASAQNNLGALLNERGDPVAALQVLEPARTAREALAAAASDDPVIRRALAFTCFNTANAHLLKRDPDAAVTWFEKATQVHEGAMRLRPGDRTDRHVNAVIRMSLGAALQAAGKQSEGTLASAVAAFQALAQEGPGEPRALVGLGFARNHLGAVQIGQIRWPGAGEQLAAAERAFDEAERAMGKLPPAYEAERLGVRVNRGLAEARWKNHKAALAHYDAVIPRLQSFRKQHPGLRPAQMYLANALKNKAETLEGLGRFGESADGLAGAIALTPEPQRSRLRVFRALNLARAGRVAEAVAEAEALAPGRSLDPESRYNLACIWAVASGKSAEARERYASAAMAQLEACRESGVIPATVSVDQVKSDPDLNPLRPLPTFGRFVEGLPTGGR